MDLGDVTLGKVLGGYIMKKLNFFSALKQFTTPKVGSARWFHSLPKKNTQELEDIRETFFQALFDPNADMKLRWKIRDEVLPYIDSILRKRDK